MKKSIRGGLIVFIVLLLIIAVFLYDGNRNIVLEEYDVKFSNLPQSFDGYRIALVTDLHGTSFGRNNSRLIAAVEAAQPDIIALGGDLTDEPGQIDEMVATAKALTEIAPVYYVTGNHEWEGGEVRTLLPALREAGIIVLQNDIAELTRGDERVNLVGLEDRNGPADMETPDSVLDRAGAIPYDRIDTDTTESDSDVFNIVLVHRNNYLYSLAALGADLILCGHAHGGIVRLPGTDGLFNHDLSLFPTHTNGIYTVGRTAMVVSRGLGNSPDVPRVFNKPHIPVVILRSVENPDVATANSALPTPEPTPTPDPDAPLNIPRARVVARRCSCRDRQVHLLNIPRARVVARG